MHDKETKIQQWFLLTYWISTRKVPFQVTSVEMWLRVELMRGGLKIIWLTDNNNDDKRSA